MQAFLLWQRKYTIFKNPDIRLFLKIVVISHLIFSRLWLCVTELVSMDVLRWLPEWPLPRQQDVTEWSLRLQFHPSNELFSEPASWNLCLLLVQAPISIFSFKDDFSAHKNNPSAALTYPKRRRTSEKRMERDFPLQHGPSHQGQNCSGCSKGQGLPPPHAILLPLPDQPLDPIDLLKPRELHLLRFRDLQVFGRRDRSTLRGVVLW